MASYTTIGSLCDCGGALYRKESRLICASCFKDWGPWPPTPKATEEDDQKLIEEGKRIFADYNLLQTLGGKVLLSIEDAKYILSILDDEVREQRCSIEVFYRLKDEIKRNTR